MISFKLVSLVKIFRWLTLFPKLSLALQIAFGAMYRVSGIMMQKDANNTIYCDTFRVSYSEEGVVWTDYVDESGDVEVSNFHFYITLYQSAFIPVLTFISKKECVYFISRILKKLQPWTKSYRCSSQ